VVISVLGFNFRTATIEKREPFQLQKSDQGDATLKYQQLSGIDEALVLATCNRVEFYRAHATKGDQGAEVIEFFRNQGVKNPESILDFSYRHVGAGAVRHLFRVISGMDSMVIGEEQIRGQIKDAYSAACVVGGTGKFLHKLLHYGFRVSKRVRHEANLGGGIRSIPGAAVALLCQGELKNKNVVVVGVNETTEVVLSNLKRLGNSPTLVNRTLYNAEKLANAYGASVEKWENLSSAMEKADFLFTATASKEPIIKAEMLAGRDSSKLLKIADLAVPRDVDSSQVKECQNVELYDLEDMRHHLAKIFSKRSDRLPEAQGIIEEQVDLFLTWLHAQTFYGGVEALKREMHEVAEDEIKRFKSSFRKSDAKALEALSNALIKKFIKASSHHLDLSTKEKERKDPSLKEELGPEEHDEELSCREKRALKDGTN